MPVIQQANASGKPPPPVAEYLWEIIEIREVDGKDKNKQVEFTFKIIGLKDAAPEALGRTRKKWCNQNLGSSDKPSHLRKVTEAAYGRALYKGEAVNTDDLLHRKVVAVTTSAKDDWTIGNMRPYPNTTAQPIFPVPTDLPAADDAAAPTTDPFAEE